MAIIANAMLFSMALLKGGRSISELTETETYHAYHLKYNAIFDDPDYTTTIRITR
jgi:hypothetical protein